MDRTAFWHYLTFIVTPAPLTMFRGIFKLPAGHIAVDRSHRPRRGAAVLGLRARSCDHAEPRAISANPRRSPN